MYRFMAAVWNPRSVENTRAQQLIGSLRASPQWSLAYEGPGILVHHVHRGQRTANTYRVHKQSGVVLGQLFERGCEDYSAAREIAFDQQRSATIIDSRGQYLIDHYWGSYLAILYDEHANRHHVFRDPLGTLRCYHSKHAGADIFFSHIEDYARLMPVTLQVNRRHLTHWLLFSSVRTDETSLENVTHLGRGESLTLSQSGMARTRVWDPTAIAATAHLHEPDAAARALRATVQSTVSAWASRYRRINHKISGGLDSSIVAGCLAHAPTRPEVNYLNMSIETDPSHQTYYLADADAKTAAKLRAIAMNGDERYFARLIAQRWNTPLIERLRYSSMDLTRLEQVPLSVAPTHYFTAMEMDDADLELIASHGTQAFFTGQAGDAALLATLQPLPAMDHAYLHAPGRELWRQIIASTALSKDSLWSVIAKTVKHGWLRRPYSGPVKVLNARTLVSRDLVQTVREEDLESTLGHLARQAALPPGKKSHVKGVASSFHNFVFFAGEHADHIDPLNSQPVWELVLRIPTYTLLTGGVSRGLARQAFADLLPPEIRKRQSKGAGTLFYQHVVRHNRSFLLERLADGLLVQQGYLDRDRLIDCLTADEPSIKIRASTLLAYLSAEVWLRRMKQAAEGHLSWESAQPPQMAAG